MRPAATGPARCSGRRDRALVLATCINLLENSTGEQLRVLLQQQQRESQLLRNELDQEFGNAKQLRQRLQEQETVLLSLREERLRLRDQLDAREGCR